jgi:hypothetical protein
MTSASSELILKATTVETMEIDKKSQQNTSKSHPVVSTQISKPTNSKIQSVSAPIISRPDIDPQLSKIAIDSELNFQLPYSSDILTDTEILSKDASFQKNITSNYSINDCREYINFIALKSTKYKCFPASSLRSESSTKRIKSRTWTKLLCCR